VLAPREAGYVEPGGHKLGQAAGQLVGPLRLGGGIVQGGGVFPAALNLWRWGSRLGTRGLGGCYVDLCRRSLSRARPRPRKGADALASPPTGGSGELGSADTAGTTGVTAAEEEAVAVCESGVVGLRGWIVGWLPGSLGSR
jgi:hypothetical protein